MAYFVKGAQRRAGWERLSHGLYLPGTDASYAMRVRAWLSVLPPSSALTHLSSAALRGWWLPSAEVLPQVFRLPPGSDRVRRDGLRVIRSSDDFATEYVGDLPVTSAAQTLVDCARDLGALDLLVLHTSATRKGAETSAALAARGRRGVAQLRRAAALADVRCESAWECLLLALHHTLGVPVVPQHEVRDDQGNFVARGDLWLEGTRTLHEYDGSTHRTPAGQREDLRRDRALLAAGWRRRAYTAYEVVHRPRLIAGDACAEVGRLVEGAALDEWSSLLRASLVTATGRHRLRQRWHL